MKSMKKQITMAVMVFAMSVTAITGCGKKFDAAAYVKGTLDANFKNEINDDYAKLVEGGREAVEKQYNDDLEELVDTFRQAGCPEDILDSYKNVLVDMMKQCKYTVGEAKKAEGSSDNYVVTVEVEPLTLDMADMQNQAASHLQEWAAQQENPSQEDAINETFNYMLTLLEEATKAPAYQEKQSVEVNVIKGDKNVYSVPDADMESLIQLMLGM